MVDVHVYVCLGDGWGGGANYVSKNMFTDPGKIMPAKITQYMKIMWNYFSALIFYVL